MIKVTGLMMKEMETEYITLNQVLLSPFRLYYLNITIKSFLGDVYSGEFKDGLRHGSGVYHHRFI